MKKIILILLSILLMSACTSQPSSPYRAAKGVSGYGYAEKSLGENRYRIEFKIANSNRKKAEDYALLRAAEFTSAQGYDWFEVNKSYIQDNSQDKANHKFDASTNSGVESRQYISRDCGLLGCRTQVHSMPDMGSDTVFPETKAILEIYFGKGIRPAKANTYDAIETSDELRKKLKLYP